MYFRNVASYNGNGRTVIYSPKADQNVLRTSMQENRLNALALWFINNDIKLDYSQEIDQFAKRNRRLNLISTDFVLCFFFPFHSNKSRKSIILKLDFRMRENAYF